MQGLVLFILCDASGLRIGEAWVSRIEKIFDNGTRVIINENAWRGEMYGFLKTDNGEREIDLPQNVAGLLIEFIGERKSGLLFCITTGKQLAQTDILRRHLHPAPAKVGFEKSGNHAFRRFRDTFLRNFSKCPASLIDFWLGWGSEGTPGHYDQIKNDVVLRKEVANACGAGFDVPPTLTPFEPNEPKNKAAVKIDVAANA